MTDEMLMHAYQRGDSKAFETLYLRHEAAMLRFVQRVLGRRFTTAQAQEVFQDAWLKIVAGRHGFAPQGAQWRTWAFAIAHNAAIDFVRQASRHGQTLEVPVADLHAQDAAWGGTEEEMALRISTAALAHAEVDNPLERAYWRAAGQRLLHCLEELPPEQRAAFLLRHEQDCSMEEAAQRLQLEFEAFRSRLRYATQKLRKCMGSYLQAIDGLGHRAAELESAAS